MKNPQILLTKRYFSHSLKQIITRLTKVIDQTATLIDGVLTGSQAKSVNQGVVDLRLSDCNLIYYTRKSSLPRSHIHKEIFVLSVKSTLPETFWENLRETNMHLCKYFLLRQKDYVSNTKMR